MAARLDARAAIATSPPTSRAEQSAGSVQASQQIKPSARRYGRHTPRPAAAPRTVQSSMVAPRVPAWVVQAEREVTRWRQHKHNLGLNGSTARIGVQPWSLSPAAGRVPAISGSNHAKPQSTWYPRRTCRDAQHVSDAADQPRLRRLGQQQPQRGIDAVVPGCQCDANHVQRQQPGPAQQAAEGAGKACLSVSVACRRRGRSRRRANADMRRAGLHGGGAACSRLPVAPVQPGLEDHEEQEEGEVGQGERGHQPRLCTAGPRPLQHGRSSGRLHSRHDAMPMGAGSRTNTC